MRDPADSGTELPWTGERCVPGLTDADTYCEHVHRYLFACELTHGGAVLDLGCGEGYGSAMLAGVADSVIGVDSDEAAIRHAERVYGNGKTRFVKAAAEDGGLLHGRRFDTIVCYEVIEHLAAHADLMANVTRLLRTDGLLFLSTPDHDVYTSDGFQNPFHIRELSRSELTELLSRYFKHVAVFTQTVTSGSLIARSDSEDARSPLSLFVGERDGPAWKPTPNYDPPYLIALASNGSLPRRLPRISLLHDARLEVIRSLQQRLAGAEAKLHELEEQTTLPVPAGRVSETQAYPAALDPAIQAWEWERRYMEIVSSRTWRVASWPAGVLSKYFTMRSKRGGTAGKRNRS
jgi:2-polyprenyl-3-methyl-5-hydroxy-6-metoxy-1,4-benzoquinol methylase